MFTFFRDRIVNITVQCDKCYPGVINKALKKCKGLSLENFQKASQKKGYLILVSRMNRSSSKGKLGKSIPKCTTCAETKKKLREMGLKREARTR